MERVIERDFSTLSWTFCHCGLSSSQRQKGRLNYFLGMRPTLHLTHLCVASTGHSAWRTVGTQDIFVIWMTEGMAHTHLSHFVKKISEYPNLLCVVTGGRVSEPCPVHMYSTKLECELCVFLQFPRCHDCTLVGVYTLWTWMIWDTNCIIRCEEDWGEEQFLEMKKKYFALLLDWVWAGLAVRLG